MSVPVSITQILDENAVESARVEYKKGWNPEPIMHTICAFANDIDNNSGGYIVVGIGDGGGSREVVGVDRGSIDSMNRNLVDLCNRIEPRYLAESDHVEFEGKDLFVIWVPGGRVRPYKCPVSLSDKRGDKAYYIRKMASTVRANASEEKELFRLSDDIPFDDRGNESASISDIKPALVSGFLREIKSKLYERSLSMPFEDLLESMNLMDGPKESRRPLNVALMFFNDRPDDFFPFARIEVVDKPEPTGEGMTEKIFTGPLDRQLIDVMAYMSNYVLKEKVVKLDDRPDSDRISNYPLKALEEAISNAVYHKSYQIHEPVTITVYPDRIEIVSIPGPFRSISDDDLRNRHLVTRRYRNRRIGEFLKELGLAEGRNTGIPTMIRSMSENGSDLPVFETDADRSYFTVILPINKAFLDVPEKIMTTGQRRTREEIMRSIVGILKDGDMTTREISERMGYGSVPSSLRIAIDVLISDGTIEYTSEMKKSPRQKLRLRNRGKGM